MSDIISIYTYKSPFGELLIGSFQNQLCLCDWKYRKMRSTIDKRICEGLNATYYEDESLVIKQTVSQLEAYFRGDRKVFDVPVLLIGTDFQKKVWDQLMKIPFGKTLSYLELSHMLENPNAIRAVASANGANAISIIVPCHRIIGSNNVMVGYAGGVVVKQKLLQLEGKKFNQQLNLNL